MNFFLFFLFLIEYVTCETLLPRPMAVEPRRKSTRNARSSSNSTVWVGSLKVTVPESELYNLFSKCGEVESCRIMRDEDGNSR